MSSTTPGRKKPEAGFKPRKSLARTPPGSRSIAETLRAVQTRAATKQAGISLAGEPLEGRNGSASPAVEAVDFSAPAGDKAATPNRTAAAQVAAVEDLSGLATGKAETPAKTVAETAAATPAKTVVETAAVKTGAATPATMAVETAAATPAKTVVETAAATPATTAVKTGAATPAATAVATPAKTAAVTLAKEAAEMPATTAAAISGSSACDEPAPQGAKQAKGLLEEMGGLINELLKMAGNDGEFRRKDVKPLLEDLQAAYSAYAKEIRAAADQARNPGAAFRAGLSTDMTVDQIAEMCKLEWPKEAYTRTTLEAASGAHQKVSTMLVHPDCLDSDRNFRALSTAIPEISAVSKETLRKEGTLVIRKVETVEISGTAATAKPPETHVLRGILLSAPEEDITIQEIRQWIKATVDVAAEVGADLIEASAPTGINRPWTRKVIECCMVGASQKIILRGGRGRAGPTETRGAILVQPNAGVSFADVLRDMKETVDLGKLGVQVDRTAEVNGAVRLEVRELRPGAKAALAETIRRSVPRASEVRAVQKRSSVLINNLDPSAEIGEVTAELAAAFRVPQSEVEVQAIRRSRDGSRYTSATMPAEVARAACRQGTVKVGWSVWKVKEKILPDRCLKCQSLGHRARDCKETEPRDKTCHRCGKPGHLARECKTADKDRYCNDCNRAGHGANTMSCPTYRKLVDDRRSTKSRNA